MSNKRMLRKTSAQKEDQKINEELLTPFKQYSNPKYLDFPESWGSDIFGRFMCKANGPTIVQNLLQEKELEYKAYLNDESRNQSLKDKKFYIFFRDKWDRETCQSLAKEINNLKGVSFLNN